MYCRELFLGVLCFGSFVFVSIYERKTILPRLPLVEAEGNCTNQSTTGVLEAKRTSLWDEHDSTQSGFVCRECVCPCTFDSFVRIE